MPPSLRAALLLAALAGPVPAEEFLSDPHNFPARFSVTGVAPDDVLNLRAAPSADAPILAELPPDATGVEVIDLSDDGAWALVPLREGIGWASTRFLAIEDAEASLTAIPLPLRCVGTEPFWSVDLREDGASYQPYDLADEPAAEWSLVDRAMSYDGFVLAYDEAGEPRDVFVMRRECTDGMSDRPYGFSTLIWDRGDRVLRGCCFFLPEALP